MLKAFVLIFKFVELGFILLEVSTGYVDQNFTSWHLGVFLKKRAASVFCARNFNSDLLGHVSSILVNKWDVHMFVFLPIERLNARFVIE